MKLLCGLTLKVVHEYFFHDNIKNEKKMQIRLHKDIEQFVICDLLKVSLLKALVVKNSVLHDFGFGKVSPAKQL